MVKTKDNDSGGLPLPCKALEYFSREPKGVAIAKEASDSSEKDRIVGYVRSQVELE
jgi:hypothetical protein